MSTRQMNSGNGVISLRGSAPEMATRDVPGPSYPGLYLAGFYDNAERVVTGARNLSPFLGSE